MKQYRARRDGMMRALAVIIGIAVSVAVSFLAHRLNLPIYPDAIGTIGVSALGGLFPGIVTGVLTDTFMMMFNSKALYFGIVNAVVAIYTAWYVRKRGLRRIKHLAVFIVGAGIIGGGLSGIIQWILFSGPQASVIVDLLNAINIQSVVLNFLFFILINISINILEKGFSTAIVLLVIHFLPKDIVTHIKNGAWRQRPLSHSETKEMDARDPDVKLSIRRRMTIMLLIVALGVAFLIGYIWTNLYNNNALEEAKIKAVNTAKAAAMAVDGDKVFDFLRNGTEAPGYKETSDVLYYIWKGSTDVEYLYVLTIDEEHVTFIFDMYDREDPAGSDAYSPGDQVEIEEEFKPHLPALLAGEEIEPVVSDNTWGWALTAYYPVRDSNGHTVCYAGADISMHDLTNYIQNFILRVALILAGFFVLIIAYGLWTTGIYIVYPVQSLKNKIKDFTGAGSDQKEIDEAVRNLRSLEINTGDEVEKLYKSICEMAASQAEQLRSVRRLSENTEKMQGGLIVTMADLVENRDSDTGAHIQKTAAYVKIIVEGLQKKGYYAEKITPKFMADVVRSAPLHDIGKISISDNILNKPGKLTDEEYEIMKTHTTEGRKIMEKAIDTVEGENYLKEARNMAAYHHERWDGKGYPEGIHGEVIPLSARIMAVADVFDALTSKRIYKPPFPLDKAVSMLQEGAGTQFDAKCVEVFIEALPEVKVILRKYNENAD